MQRFQQRTDLALEARELASAEGGLPGVDLEESLRAGLPCQKVSVKTQAGSEALGKPIGNYYTLNISSLLRRESGGFPAAVEALASVLRELLRPTAERCSLVAALGNRDITPDNIGPLAAESILVTRHLKQYAAEDFKMLSSVALVTPGVMARSGIESADYIGWVCRELNPAQVIAIDALAAKDLDRLCRTIQITDTGITPGSGVGNARSAINAETLGLPVIAIGVPTVVDISSLLPQSKADSGRAKEMIVTPRDIDAQVECAARLVGYGLNCALHDGLKIEDIDMLVG